MEPLACPVAVFFDLDGTLADTLEDIHEALNATRVEAGLPPIEDGERVRSWVGHGARRLIARALGTEDVERADVAEQMVAFRRIYPPISGRHSRLYPGMREMLVDLRGRGAKLAVTTNKPRAATLTFLERTDAAGLFDAVFTPDDVGGRTKPDPAMLLAAAEAVRAAPADCLLVGDGTADLEGGRAAGMPVVAVLGGFTKRELLLAIGAQHYVERATDLLARIVGARP